MSDDILTEVKDGVLVITINRPDAKNAMNKAGAEGIAAALDNLSRSVQQVWRASRRRNSAAKAQ